MMKLLPDWAKLVLQVWDISGIGTETKLRVYSAVVLPTLLYGAESWTVYKTHADKLNRFHVSCLKRILGIHWSEKVPDTEVLERAKAPSIYCHLKKIQLRWAGHLVRMPNTRLPKAIFYSELVRGKRKVGAPRKRYKDTLKTSLKDCSIDVGDWETLCLDRSEWRRTVTCGSKAFEKNRICKAKAARAERKERQQNPSAGTGRTEHQCSACGKFFSKRIALEGHKRTHKWAISYVFEKFLSL